MAAPDVLLIHDGNAMVSGVETMLADVAPVRTFNLRREQHPDVGGADGAVICVQLSTPKGGLRQPEALGAPIDEAVFVMPSFSQEYVEALTRLGVAGYIVAPAQPMMLSHAVGAVRDRILEARWEQRPPVLRDSLFASRSSFLSAFGDVRSGGRIDITQITDGCRLIAEAASQESLTDWLAAIKDHHDYTYRHSMFVCGSIVQFGEAIGLKGADLTLLSVGGLLHDIGKARIPLNILDKPSKLTIAEQVTMRIHPTHSRDIMETMEGLDPRIVAMAVSHHEKLDGSGYPDGLKGAEIDDLVRITSIADVFSALIDERSYKAAMSFEAAFARMEGMTGHLDMQILARFREFAMDSLSEAA